MLEYNLYIISKALHVVAIVAWIGGVGFVTTVLIPAIKKSKNQKSKLNLFVELEGRFSPQAKILNGITGLTGLYMLYYLNAWNRFVQPNYWWMHLMVLIWFIFFIVLFFLEPIFLHKWFEKIAETDDTRAVNLLFLIHLILLMLSISSIFIVVLGSNGMSI